MSVLLLESMEITTGKKDMILTHQGDNFVLIKTKDYQGGFYRRSNQEWKPFRGILLDYKETFRKATIIHQIIEEKWCDKSLDISKTLGGGFWLKTSGRGSYLDLPQWKSEDPYLDINLLVKSKFISRLRSHNSRIHLFTTEKDDFDCLNFHQEEKMIELDSLEEIPKINMKDIFRVNYQDYSLPVYLLEFNLKILENLLRRNPEICLGLKFYKKKNNRDLLDTFEIIYYLQKSDTSSVSYLLKKFKFSFDNYLVKTSSKEWNLIEVLLTQKPEVAQDVVKNNYDFFTSKKIKTEIKKKTTILNSNISHILTHPSETKKLS